MPVALEAENHQVREAERMEKDDAALRTAIDLEE